MDRTAPSCSIEFPDSTRVDHLAEQLAPASAILSEIARIQRDDEIGIAGFGAVTERLALSLLGGPGSGRLGLPGAREDIPQAVITLVTRIFEDRPLKSP